MKKLLIILLVILAAYVAKAQSVVEIKGSSVKVTNGNFSYEGLLTYLDANTTTSQINMIVGGKSVSFFSTNVTSFKINGVSQPISLVGIRDALENSKDASSGGGGGSGTSDATAANQVALNTLTSRQVDSITNLLAISRRKIALDSGYLRRIQDSTNKQIVQLDSLIAATKRNTGGAASSDSSFIKDVVKVLKDSSVLATLKQLVQLNKDSSLFTPFKDYVKTFKDSNSRVFLVRSLDSLGKIITRQDTIIKKQNDLINLQNVFNNLSLINNDTTNIISGNVRALLKGYTDSVANTNTKLQSQIVNQLRIIDSLAAINNNKALATLQQKSIDTAKITNDELRLLNANGVGLKNSNFTTIISGSNTSIPTVFKSGFIEWLNAGTGTVTITTSGGGSTVLTSLYNVRSWLPIDSKNYTGITVTLSGGALIQWSFNN